MTERRRSRRRGAGLAVVLAITLLSVACSVEETLPRPHCAAGGSGLIVAQSVPRATQVPCLTALPEGWSVSSVNIDETHTLISLDSDRAGDDAAKLRFEASCDLDGVVSTPSDLAGAERFDRIESLTPAFRAQRLYRFPGGCVTWEFDFDRSTSATESVAIGESLSLIARDELNEMLRDTFLDREI